MTLEARKLHDPRRPLVMARHARYWTSAGGTVIHQWWCMMLHTAPGLEEALYAEKFTPAEVAATVPARQLCGHCFEQEKYR